MIDLVQKPPPGVTRDISFGPISSFSNRCSIWNLIFFYPRLRNTPQVGIRISSAQPTCMPGCHSPSSPTSCWLPAVIHSPGMVTGWNSLFGINQGPMVHYKFLVLLLLESPENFNSSVQIWVKTQYANSVTPFTSQLAHPKAPNSPLHGRIMAPSRS